MGGRTGLCALALSLLSCLAHCSDDRTPVGAPCTSGIQCKTGLCLEGDTGGGVCVVRCATDTDCPASAVCGRFDFRGRDDAGVPAGKDTDVVRVCRSPLQPRCAAGCPPGDVCVGEAESVCAPPCRDRRDCGGRDCVVVGCAPGRCEPACDSLRDCPRFFVCDTAFLGTDGHGRCLPVKTDGADGAVDADAVCVDAP